MTASLRFQSVTVLAVVVNTLIVAVLGTPDAKYSGDDEPLGDTEAVNQASVVSSAVAPLLTTRSGPSSDHPLIILSWSSISIIVIVAGILVLSSAILYGLYCFQGNGQHLNYYSKENSRLEPDSSVPGSLMKTQSLSESRNKSTPDSKSSSGDGGSSSSPSALFFSQSKNSSGVYFNSADRSPVRINPPPSTIGTPWSGTGLLVGSTVTSTQSAINSSAAKSTVSGVGGSVVPSTTSSSAATSGLEVARSNPTSVIGSSGSADSKSGLKSSQKRKKP